MHLPSSFQFSQNNLQDYIDCPRRFELRYILRQQWPALPSEPVLEQERHMELGRRLHEMIHQHLTGIPAELIEDQADDPKLLDWWQGYLSSSIIPDQFLLRSSESLLTATITQARVVARYDLLVYTSDQRALIFDWKTGIKRTSRRFLQERMQTRVYPCLLSIAGKFPDRSPVDPSQVSLNYWFANFPKEHESFAYSVDTFNKDLDYISNLIHQIRRTETGRFILASNEKACSFCVYRSLCDRGIQAGDWKSSPDEDENNSLKSLDFDLVDEIEI